MAQEDPTGRPVSQGPWAQILAVLTDRDRVKQSSVMMESDERAGCLKSNLVLQAGGWGDSLFEQLVLARI